MDDFAFDDFNEDLDEANLIDPFDDLLEKYLMLCPGNWFELRTIKKNLLEPYDMVKLQKEILDQVSSRSDKLESIDVSFGTIYGKDSLEKIALHLDEKKFEQMIKLSEQEKLHPIITFHGTPSYDNVTGILEKGYLIPGKDVKEIKVTNGKMYGIGIYSSPHFDKASHYTALSKKQTAYILINIVFLGKMHLIPPGGNNTKYSEPKNGIYADGIHTRVVYGLEQLISADPHRVIPVGVMHLKSK